MREQTCCFTGHREIPEYHDKQLRLELKTTAVKLIERGIRFFGAGGALGFDTLAAQTVLALKPAYPHIRLILVLPCPDQDLYWSPSQRRDYREVCKCADKVVYVSTAYDRTCMYRRNRHLVDCSSVCVAYCTREWGGTAYTVRYAERKGLELIFLP